MAQVHAALAYYWSHRDEIHQDVENEEKLVAELRAKAGPSKIQERLAEQDAADDPLAQGNRSMLAAEFQAKVIAGKIEIPEPFRAQFQGEVNVILFAEGGAREESGWPGQNKRRWELIAKMVRQGLTAEETKELATLQQRADEQLAQVGSRPVEELERLYADLSQEG